MIAAMKTDNVNKGNLDDWVQKINDDPRRVRKSAEDEWQVKPKKGEPDSYNSVGVELEPLEHIKIRR